MTKEEKEKAIDVLKMSAPVMDVTREEYNAYILIINKVIDWLEQQPVFDKYKTEGNKLCTQRCCLKNHNSGTIECDEECNNRTTF